MRRSISALMFVVLLPACGQEHANLSATPEGRYALGVGIDYPADPLSDQEQRLIKESMLARRAVAWSVVQRVLAGVTPATHPSSPEIPRWLTWYGEDDLERIFTEAFTSLSPDQRRQRSKLTDKHFDQAEEWLANQLLHLPQWTDERRAALFAGLIDDKLWRGTAGLSRTLFSPSAARHIVTQYNQVASCAENTCLVDPFPSDSVIIKTQWTRRASGFSVPVFRTDAESLETRLSQGGMSWNHPDHHVADIANRSLDIKLSEGVQFDLTGLHIMTKESKDWLWITLWWSENPNEDFGEDRPESLRNGPWSYYKMCVAGDFSEASADSDELLQHFPALGAAILSSRDNSGFSWCSNPYLEKGEHNQKTNCLGCHQFAGTTESPEDVVKRQHQGRARVFGQFPADYVWSLNFGADNVGHMLNERVRYHTGQGFTF